MTPTPSEGPLLAIDSGSPVLSVAVGSRGTTLAMRDAPAERSSARIMELVHGCLADAGLRPLSLAGIVVLAGPGSFTGLRVGMSIALGFHQALGLPTGVLSTFRALASQAPDPDRPVLAVVRALRSEWYAQRFASPLGDAGEPGRLAEVDLAQSSTGQIVGFDVASISASAATDASTHWTEPGPLAPAILSLGGHVSWDPAALTRPAYLAPAPVHAPRA